MSSPIAVKPLEGCKIWLRYEDGVVGKAGKAPNGALS